MSYTKDVLSTPEKLMKGIESIWVEKKDKISLIINKNILNKIKYLCKNIPKLEWSGVLVYSVKGTIKDPKNMVLTVEDILPMNVGDSVTTGFQYNEKKRSGENDDKVVDFFMNNPSAMLNNWKIGLIHSHNVMSVFFSGTDKEELEDNSSGHDFYLSLIVNNFMDFTAKVAVKAVVKKSFEEELIATDELGSAYSVGTTTVDINSSKLLVYDCNIKSPKEEITVDSNFKKSVQSIIDEKNRKEKEVDKVVDGYWYHNSYNSWNKEKAAYKDNNTKHIEDPTIDSFHDDVEESFSIGSTVFSEYDPYLEKLAITMLLECPFLKLIPEEELNDIDTVIDIVTVNMNKRKSYTTMANLVAKNFKRDLYNMLYSIDSYGEISFSDFNDREEFEEDTLDSLIEAFNSIATLQSGIHGHNFFREVVKSLEEEFKNVI